MSKKKIQYYIRYTCDACAQSWFDPNSYLAKELAEGEEKGARILFYGEYRTLIKSGSKVVDRTQRHASPYECITSLKEYIESVRLQLDDAISDQINDHLTTNHSYY